jgi:agarase
MRRNGWLLPTLLLVLAVAGVEAQQPVEIDQYGGWTGVKTAATGWFRTARSEGRWWLVDPEGHPFLSVGVNTVSFRQDTVRGTSRSPYGEATQKKHGSAEAWAEAAVARLWGWGFNTLGAWSDRVTWRRGMPYTVILHFADAVRLGEERTFPDVFDPAYDAAVRRLARRVCGPLVGDPNLIGYFTDNELRWGPDWRSPETLFEEFLRLPDEAHGRRALLRFLEDRYLNISELNQAWQTGYDSFAQVGRIPQVGSQIPDTDKGEFLRAVALRYFSISEDAIRLVDDKHLILGCRLAGHAPGAVLEAMKEHVDVVSLNHYDVHPPAALLREVHWVTGRPVIVTEFSFRARDSGLPNAKGAGVVVDTQEERAEHFERYVRELLGLPMVVGYHWFEHADQPSEGRFDGENSNYGLVNIRDDPYHVLVDTMMRVNSMVYEFGAVPATSR